MSRMFLGIVMVVLGLVVALWPLIMFRTDFWSALPTIIPGIALIVTGVCYWAIADHQRKHGR